MRLKEAARALVWRASKSTLASVDSVYRVVIGSAGKAAYSAPVGIHWCVGSYFRLVEWYEHDEGGGTRRPAAGGTRARRAAPITINHGRGAQLSWPTDVDLAPATRSGLAAQGAIFAPQTA